MLNTTEIIYSSNSESNLSISEKIISENYCYLCMKYYEDNFINGTFDYKKYNEYKELITDSFWAAYYCFNIQYDYSVLIYVNEIDMELLSESIIFKNKKIKIAKLKDNKEAQNILLKEMNLKKKNICSDIKNKILRFF